MPKPMMVERLKRARLRHWQFYWSSWHFGWCKPYPDKHIKGITHWLVFIGPLQLWFYL